MRVDSETKVETDSKIQTKTDSKTDSKIESKLNSTTDTNSTMETETQDKNMGSKQSNDEKQRQVASKIMDTVTYNSESRKNIVRASALHLKNHFGYESDNSPYAGGNRMKNQFDPHKLNFKDRDGVWTSPINTNLDNNTVIGDSCDIKQSAYYSHCTNLPNCTVCMNNEHCEWCKTSNKCNPIVKAGCRCPEVCMEGIDPYRLCDDFPAGTQILGKAANIAPESQGKENNAVFAPLKVVETQREYEIVDKETAIPMKSKTERVKVSFLKRGLRNEYNQLTTEWVNHTSNQYYFIPHTTMKEKITKRNLDPETLHEIKLKEEEKVLHGFNPEDKKIQG